MARRRQSSGSPGCALLVFGIALIAFISYVADAIGWPLTIAAIVVLVVFFARMIYRRVAVRTPRAQELMAGLQNVSSMSGAQFEVFVAQILRAQGYVAQVLGGSGDQGVDIIATATDGRIAVQCKNYRKPVGNKPIQEVYAGARHHRCDHAWVVAPNGYTKGAHELARSVGVTLFDANSLRVWIKTVDRAPCEREEQQAAQVA